MTQNKKKKTFTVSWTESVGYYVDIEANSKEEALEEWMRGDCEEFTNARPRNRPALTSLC